MDTPILSIVIPVYNTEEYLKRCMDSIIYQTESNIEIIVINDCSKGDTDAIMAPYLKDKRVRYYKQKKNRGLGASRNLGILKATGKYITFCDSDDWVDIGLYKKMCVALERTQADIAICGTKKEFPSGEDAIIKAAFEQESLFDSDTVFRMMTFEYSYGITITPSATNKVVRKQLIDIYNIKFPEGIYYEDWLYSIQLMTLSDKVVCVPKYYYHYFRRDGSIIVSISKQHIKSFYFAFLHIKEFLIQNDMYDLYMMNYYKFGERFYNLIIRQIFEFGGTDEEKKELIKYSVRLVKKLITLSEFIEYCSAEKLRRHIQPYITDTKIV